MRRFLFYYAEFCAGGVAQCVGCANGVRAHLDRVRNNFARPGFADKVIVNKPEYCRVGARGYRLERYVGDIAIIGNNNAGVGGG